MDTPDDIWILIGGTGQQFGVTAGSLALVGALPAPSSVLLIDADAGGHRFDRLTRVLDLIRANRFVDGGTARPLQIDKPLTSSSIGAEYKNDPLLKVLYGPTLIAQQVTDGFHCEPSLGAASYYPTLKRTAQAGLLADGQAGRDDLAAFLANMGAPDPARRRIFVVGSTAGGTGAGLWNLVCRAIASRGPVWREATRLIMFGPLFQLTQTQEKDGRGQTLTTARLDENFAASFEYLRQISSKSPPFGAAYVVSYPAGSNRPIASATDRTDLASSRLTLVAATALGHDLANRYDGQLFGFRADRSSTGRLEELAFRNTLGRWCTGADLRKLAESANRSFRALSQVNLPRAASGLGLFARRKASRRVLHAITLADRNDRRATAARVEKWQGSAEDAKQNGAQSLRGVSIQAQELAAEFALWLSNPDAHVATPSQKDATRLLRRRWQAALDENSVDEAAGDNPAFHVRRWLAAIACGAVRRDASAPAVSSTGATIDYLPVPSGRGGRLGWNPIDRMLDTGSTATLAEGSFPTPMARARWLAAHLSTEQPGAALKVSMSAWRAVVGGYVRPGAPVVSPLATVVGYVEFGDESHSIIPLLLDVDVPGSGVAKGAVVGLVHPESGPFLGVSFDGLARTFDTDAEHYREDIAALSALAVSQHEHAPWNAGLRALAAGAAPRAPATTIHTVKLSAGAMAISLSVRSPPETIGTSLSAESGQDPARSGVETVRLLGFREARRSVPSLLAVRDREQGIARLLASKWWPESRAVGDTVEFDRPLTDQEASRGGSERADAFDWLTDWNIEVWPGRHAPAEWRHFGLAIEPQTPEGLIGVTATVIVERGDGTLHRVELNGSGNGLRPYSWLDGRPRFLVLDVVTPGKPPAVGYFKLLDAPTSRRDGQQVRVALDLGTTRSALAVFSPGTQDADPRFREGAHALTLESGTLASHLRRRPNRSWIPELDNIKVSEGDPDGALHVAIHGSTILRRGGSSGREPIADFTIPTKPVPKDASGAAEVTNLKWGASDRDLEDFITLSALIAVSQADLRTPGHSAPRDATFHFSFPLAFSNRRRTTLEGAAKAALARVETYTGLTCKFSGLCSESTLATLKQDDHPWTLTVDIGGGTTDFALLLRHRLADATGVTSVRDFPVVTDSLEFAGAMMVERVVRGVEAQKRDWQWRLTSYEVRVGNAAVLELDKPGGIASTTLFFHTLWEYTARLLASALIRASRGQVPSHLRSEAAALEPALIAAARSPRVVVMLLGGGWRLLEGLFDLDWRRTAAGSEIDNHLTGALAQRVNELMVLAGAPGDVTIQIDTSPLQRGEEKTRLAQNMVKHWAVAERQQMTSASHGVYTSVGLDVDEQFTWHGELSPKISGRPFRGTPALSETLPPPILAACATRNPLGDAKARFESAAAEAPVGKVSKSPYGAYLEAVVRPAVVKDGQL